MSLKCSGFFAEYLESRRLLSAGQIDSTFGFNGVASDLFPGGPNVLAVASQSNGKILLGGGDNANNAGLAEAEIARLNWDGSVDHSFGDDGRVIVSNIAGIDASEVSQIAVQTDGKILLLVPSEYDSATYVVRLLPSGSIDPSFGKGGVVSLSEPISPFTIAVQPNGKIVVAGSNSLQGQGAITLARLSPSGALDKSFGSNGVVTENMPGLYTQATGLLIEQNGDIFVRGETSSISSLVLSRFLPDGKLDASFGTGGIVAEAQFTAWPGAMAVGANGDVLVGATSAVSDDGSHVLAITARGTLDAHFGQGGVASLDDGETFGPVSLTISTEKNGDIVAVDGNAVATEFTANGKLNAAYGVNGHAAPPAGFSDFCAAIQQSDGRMVLESNNVGDVQVLRYDISGFRDWSFGYQGVVSYPYGFTGSINAIATERNGDILTAGSELSPWSDVPTEAALACYRGNGTDDTSFGDDGEIFLQIGENAQFTSLVVAPNGEIYAAGMGQAAATGPGASIDVLAVYSFNPNGTPNASFGAKGEVLTRLGAAKTISCSGMALQSNGDIVVAGTTFDAKGNAVQMAAVRLLPSGKLDPKFGIAGQVLLSPGGESGQVNSMAIQSDGEILLAGAIGSNFGIVRLGVSGAVDATFGVGGSVVAPEFDQSGDPIASSVDAIALEPNGDIVAAGAPTAANLPGVLARYLPNGTLDSTFGANGIISPRIPPFSQEYYFYYLAPSSLAIGSDGTIFVGNAVAVYAFNSQGPIDGFGFHGGSDYPPVSEFEPSPYVSALAVLPDGDILAGDSSVSPDLFRVQGG